MSEHMGDRPIPIFPLLCFPLTQISSGHPCPALSDQSLPRLRSRPPAGLSSALQRQVISQTLCERTVCSPGMASSLSSQAQSSQHPCCHPVSATTCQPQAAGHSTGPKGVEASFWVWLPRASMTLCLSHWLMPVTCLPITAREAWKSIGWWPSHENSGVLCLRKMRREGWLPLPFAPRVSHPHAPADLLGSPAQRLRHRLWGCSILWCERTAGSSLVWALSLHGNLDGLDGVSPRQGPSALFIMCHDEAQSQT